MQTLPFEPHASLRVRLMYARLGAPSPVLARRLVADFAALPLDLLLQEASEQERSLLGGILELRSLEELDPARGRGWDVPRACAAEAAWAVEQLFGLGERCRDQVQARRIERRARPALRTLACIALAWEGAASWALGEADFSPCWLDEDVSRRNLGMLRAHGSREQLRALFGVLTMPCAELFDACRDLVAARLGAEKDLGPAALGLIDRARASAAQHVCDLRERTLMEAIAGVGRDPVPVSLLRALLVQPLAALWSSGALSRPDLRPAPASRSVPGGELERRLRAA